MAIASVPADYARNAAAAYERQLSEQLDQLGTTPNVDPETAGRRAAAHTTAGLAWAAEVGPFFDTDGARVALGGVTKQAISARVSAGRLLGLRLAADGSSRDRMVYPAWQFRPMVLRQMSAVLAAAGFDPSRPTTGWTIAAWLTTPDPDLEGLMPLQMLEAGHVGSVILAARDVGESLGAAELAGARASQRQAG